jgi:hypothetical protein
VDIFFALSGFLITSRLIRESDQNGAISLRSFYIRRAFRILPASWTYLIVIAILCISGVMNQPVWSILACLLLCRNYFPMQKPSGEYPGLYTGHFWSLAVEEHFYLFWPFLLSRMRMEKATRFAIAAATGFTVWSISDGYFPFCSCFPVLRRPRVENRHQSPRNPLGMRVRFAVPEDQTNGFSAKLGPSLVRFASLDRRNASLASVCAAPPSSSGGSIGARGHGSKSGDPIWATSGYCAASLDWPRFLQPLPLAAACYPIACGTGASSYAENVTYIYDRPDVRYG